MAAIGIPDTRMNETRTLLRLMTWLTASMPTGSFAYSSGLEAAVADGHVDDRRDLERWLDALLVHGSSWSDAVLLSETLKAPEDANALAELARALAGSSLRSEQTLAQGDAFLDAARSWIGDAPLKRPCPLPIALGWAAAGEALPHEPVIAAYLHGFVAAEVQAALRLMALGQIGAARVMAALEEQIARTAARAHRATIADLGTFAFGADIAVMRHETLPARMFRS